MTPPPFFMKRKTPPDWVLALLLVVGVFLWQRTTFPLWMIDLFHIQLAAHEWRVGEIEWIYTPLDRFAAWEAHRGPIAEQLGSEGNPNAYFYPPFLAAMLSPFSEVPARMWMYVLFGINTGLLFVFAYLITRVCAVPITWRAFLWALVLVLVTYPMARATKLGQIVPLQAALLWAGLLWMRKTKIWRAGAVLGLVSALKLFPVGLVIVPALERKWQAVIAWLGSIIVIYGISVLLLGIEVHRLWWQAIRDFSAVLYVYQGNQAPSAWLARAVMGIHSLTPAFACPPELEIYRWIGRILFGGGTVAAFWLTRRADHERAFAARIGLVGCGILLALPVAWEHYWMFLLPVLGWAVHYVWVNRDQRFWEMWLAAAAFFFTMKLTRFYGNWPVRAFMSGSQMWGMLLLWVWLMRWSWRARKDQVTSKAEIVPHEALS
jgi:hypothetical protein